MTKQKALRLSSAPDLIFEFFLLNFWRPKEVQATESQSVSAGEALQSQRKRAQGAPWNGTAQPAFC
jgi:hypothetical protein